MEVQTRSPLVSSLPVPPEERSRSHRQGMEQDAHLARFGRCAAVPLALLAQGTRTTGANAGSRDHPQTAISFSTVFLRGQCVACGTLERSIGLERKVSPSEAVRFLGRCGSRWSRARGGWGSYR
jgi:hypothetical protein